MTAPRVLVAPDKFKGSLAAGEVADAVARGIVAVLPAADVACVPVADGGDGTLAAAVAAVAAGWERFEVTGAGATGEPVRTGFARRGDTAVVEMADACGLDRLPGGVPAPLRASSRGLGEVIAAALDAGCREIVVGIGGSASTDGGAGMLAALGARVLDADGRALPDGGGALAEVAAVDLSGLHPALPDTEVVVACDVDNPLVGEHGAAAVYGPQKGATPDDVTALDRALSRWADVVAAASGLATAADGGRGRRPGACHGTQPPRPPTAGGRGEVEPSNPGGRGGPPRGPSRDRRDTPGAGAAGGVGFAALAVLGAELRPGIDLVLDLVGFDAALAGSDLVVTGEGSLDEQSLRGKAPVGVATRAGARGTPVVAVCGRRTLSDAALRGAGIEAAYALLDVEPDVEACLRDPGPLLEQLGRAVARRHLS